MLFLLALVACRRADVARPDPTPPVDAKHTPAPAPLTTRVSLHGRIVDVTTGEVKHALRDKLSRDEATDARATYVLDDDAMLRAYELSSGTPLWSLATSARTLEVDDNNVYLIEGTDVVAVNKTNGVPRRVAASSTIDEVRPFPGHLAVRRGATVDIYRDTLLARASFTARVPIQGFIDQWHRSLIATSTGVCFVLIVSPDYEVRCLDELAKESSHAVVTLTKPGDPPYSRFMAIASTPHHVVIGTHSFGGSGLRRAAVIRLSDGKEVASVEDEIVAVTESPSGALDGMISVGEEVHLYDASGALRWKYKPKWPESFAKVLSHDGTLVFAMHNVIATGVEVFALRKSDGRELWLGETRLPPIGHSKYHNNVTLEHLGDAAILRGHESSVEHVHVYDVTTGKLRYHDP